MTPDIQKIVEQIEAWFGNPLPDIVKAMLASDIRSSAGEGVDRKRDAARRLNKTLHAWRNAT